MTKILIAATMVVLLIVGTSAGWYFAQISSLRKEHNHNERREKFQAELEGLTPSCTDLKSEGIKGPYSVGKGYAFIHVEREYFHVVGFISEAGKPFMTDWWGAGRQNAIDQSCKEDKP